MIMFVAQVKAEFVQYLPRVSAVSKESSEQMYQVCESCGSAMAGMQKVQKFREPLMVSQEGNYPQNNKNWEAPDGNK